MLLQGCRMGVESALMGGELLGQLGLLLGQLLDVLRGLRCHRFHPTEAFVHNAPPRRWLRRRHIGEARHFGPL